MLATINNFVQTILVIIGVFLIERYVLLEPAMEPKKQRIFYIIACGVTMLLFFVAGNDAASYSAVLFGGLNISLGRKKHRVIGFAMIIPLVGIINGSMAAVFNIVLFSVGDDPNGISQIVMLAAQLIMLALLMLFYFKSRNWRKWFAENMKDRRLSRSEYIIILISGTLMIALPTVVSHFMSDDLPKTIWTSVTMISYCIISITLSMTIIVMIMQGNKRKLYYDKIEKMQFSVISTMADIVEDRDSNTGGHVKRTARYVEITGKKLQASGAFPETLTNDYLSDMIVAAPLHDIGKIHIPDAILNKPGKLTDEEFAIMKTHAAAGRDILIKAQKQLGDFDYISTAIKMAEYHHEWWNGKGYPNAISGEEIPLCARIMAVADVFDALTAKRCYKAAMPLEKAFGIIKEESGTHFDPTVAEAFLSARAEVEAAIAELSPEE